MYGAELQIRSAPHAEIKSEADDRAYSEPNKASKTDVREFVRALDSGGLIRVIGRRLVGFTPSLRGSGELASSS